MLKKINYQFENLDLLRVALTHRSVAGQKTPHQEEISGGETDNQRLEFLGDAVLDLVISEYLYQLDPKLSEGEMSRLRAGLVRETRLAEVAERLSLGEALVLGPGEAQGGGRHKPSLLADALEALLGAVYLDGGLEEARTLVIKLWKVYLQNKGSWARMLDDYKTRLQEESQGRGLGSPQYQLVESQGPDHARTFIMAVNLEGRELGRASGSTKKEAEQKAAREALTALGAGETKNEAGGS